MVAMSRTCKHGLRITVFALPVVGATVQPFNKLMQILMLQLLIFDGYLSRREHVLGNVSGYLLQDSANILRPRRLWAGSNHRERNRTVPFH